MLVYVAPRCILRADVGCCRFSQRVIVDLAETLAIDSTALGCLARLSLAVQRIQAKIPTLICRSSDIERVLLNMGFDDGIFAIVAEANVQDVELVDIPAVVEQEARQRVIEAHKVLMSLNDSNRAAFKSLVDALEQDGSSRISLSGQQFGLNETVV